MTTTARVLSQCDDAIYTAIHDNRWSHETAHHLTATVIDAITPIIDKLISPDVPAAEAAHDDKPEPAASIHGPVWRCGGVLIFGCQCGASLAVKILHAKSVRCGSCGTIVMFDQQLAWSIEDQQGIYGTKHLDQIEEQIRDLDRRLRGRTPPSDTAETARLNGKLAEAGATIDCLQQQVAESDKRIRMFRQQVRGLNRALNDQRVILTKRTKEVRSLQDQLTELKPAGNVPKRYPYDDGGFLVLGPECFLSPDGDVVCRKGVNYYRRPRVLTLTDDLIEEAAKAAYEAPFNPDYPQYHWHETADQLRTNYRTEARAALTVGLAALGFNVDVAPEPGDHE